MFFFGCMDILSETSEDQATCDESDKAKQKEEPEDFTETFEKTRTKVIDTLNNSNILTNVSDLFVPGPSWILFNPIVADIHIPISLQKEQYHEGASVEGLPQDFKIIYDGMILVVAAFCQLDRRPSGVYDVRDKFRDLLSTVCKFEEVPPCLTHQSVVLLDKKEAIWKSKRDVRIATDLSSDFMELARKLYLELIDDMHQFYHCCEIANKLETQTSNIHTLESLLLDDLRKFLKTDWKEIRKRRRITAQFRNGMVEILDGLCKYSYDLQELDKAHKSLDDTMRHNPRLNELVRKIRALEEYTKPRKEMDINSSMRIVEHARLELETYSVNTSTMLSALAGAIIGSVLTLVATYFLGTRSYVLSPTGNATQTSFVNVAYAFLSSILITSTC